MPVLLFLGFAAATVYLVLLPSLFMALFKGRIETPLAATVRLVASAAATLVQSVRLAGDFTPWRIYVMFSWIVTLCLCAYALKLAKRAALPRLVPEPAAAPPPGPSSAVRLQEIKSEMAELDAEKRELEKHPDANRF